MRFVDDWPKKTSPFDAVYLLIDKIGRRFNSRWCWHRFLTPNLIVLDSVPSSHGNAKDLLHHEFICMHDVMN